MNTMIEIYDRIMGVVEEVTGISKDKILTSNCEECVDARHILVYILGNRSFSDNKIAELTGLTRPGVCIIRNNFKYRRKRYFLNAMRVLSNTITSLLRMKPRKLLLHSRIRMVVRDPNGVTPMNCLKRLRNTMVRLNANLTIISGLCMSQ
mgnify:CR=1 FL=1